MYQIIWLDRNSVIVDTELADTLEEAAYMAYEHVCNDPIPEAEQFNIQIHTGE